jgi:hypothetical protein
MARQHNFYFLFCFFIFVNLREGKKNPTKKKTKKSKYVRLSIRPSSRADSTTEKAEADSAVENAAGTSNHPRSHGHTD